MTKAHSRDARKAQHPRQAARRQEMPDGAVYIGILLVGAFGTALWTTLGGEWRHAAVGFLLAVAVLVNLYAWRVTRGDRLARWQQALARLPLRWAGYGTAGGKPLEAAHGSPRARAMLLVSIATSAVVITGLSLLIIPR